ncbi:hypothetical protein E2562_009547 [Oryza meyeriana var. granulata]|uniref:Uncharacterized protein n=1 Tax=Oryza meyeriana var. granulata TaxID=110450 RepID=A0A6G1F5X7_9ORYZ|nr:hypothetical protein E2562_009547 [Oryza meyeriana var. granulata]
MYIDLNEPTCEEEDLLPDLNQMAQHVVQEKEVEQAEEDVRPDVEHDDQDESGILQEEELHDDLDVYADHVDIVLEQEELSESDEEQDDMHHDV